MPTWCYQCGRMISDVINPGGDTESLCDGCISVGLLEDDKYDDQDLDDYDPEYDWECLVDDICPECGAELVREESKSRCMACSFKFTWDMEAK